VVGGEAQFTKREGKNETVPLTKRVADMIAALGNSGRYVAGGNLILLLLAFLRTDAADRHPHFLDEAETNTAPHRGKADCEYMHAGLRLCELRSLSLSRGL
jgi:hypothetical protein